MQLLPMGRLGPVVVNANTMQFGLLLPWVSSEDGYQLVVKLTHERDQFLQDIGPKEFELGHSMDDVYGDYWSTDVRIDPADRPHPKSAWGTPGRYVYRFELRNPGRRAPIDWIIDPYAREFGVGKLSAFTLGYTDHLWSHDEANWKTPPIEKLVVYELRLREFGGNVDGSIQLLEYLRDLGIRCVEIMPVSNVALVQEGGFLPIGLFGVDERFGNRKDFQRFVDEAHRRGIAVILDAVYGHTSNAFAYQHVYTELGFSENPFMGPFAKNYVGCSTDFGRKLTQDYYFTVNQHWLEAYHVDGFRYDCVPTYYVGPSGDGYADLVSSTYQLVKAQIAAGQWQRFASEGSINLIQCAEQLEGPVDILANTYSNATWQNETLDAARRVAAGDRGALADLGLRLGLPEYPSVVTMNGDTIRKTAFQYLETHDHERFICHLGMKDQDNPLLAEGDRSRWFKLQPFLIALLTAKGTPMLWQGQEICENDFFPDAAFGRVMLERPVRWDYFYDDVGQNVIRLVRQLLKIRNEGSQFQGGEHFFYNNWDRYQSKGLLLFSRYNVERFTLVALNFSDETVWAPFWFPTDGFYREQLEGKDHLKNVMANEEWWLEIPANYGRIWTRD